jgi:hypothetical protein
MNKEQVLDRLKKLIAQSSSPEEEEARTAAKMAFDLMRQHNLIDPFLAFLSGRTQAQPRKEPIRDHTHRAPTPPSGFAPPKHDYKPDARGVYPAGIFGNLYDAFRRGQESWYAESRDPDADLKEPPQPKKPRNVP